MAAPAPQHAGGQFQARDGLLFREALLAQLAAIEQLTMSEITHLETYVLWLRQENTRLASAARFGGDGQGERRRLQTDRSSGLLPSTSSGGPPGKKDRGHSSPNSPGSPSNRPLETLKEEPFCLAVSEQEQPDEEDDQVSNDEKPEQLPKGKAEDAILKPPVMPEQPTHSDEDLAGPPSESCPSVLAERLVMIKADKAGGAEDLEGVDPSDTEPNPSPPPQLQQLIRKDPQEVPDMVKKASKESCTSNFTHMTSKSSTSTLNGSLGGGGDLEPTANKSVTMENDGTGTASLHTGGDGNREDHTGGEASVLMLPQLKLPAQGDKSEAEPLFDDASATNSIQCERLVNGGGPAVTYAEGEEEALSPKLPSKQRNGEVASPPEEQKATDNAPYSRLPPQIAAAMRARRMRNSANAGLKESSGGGGRVRMSIAVSTKVMSPREEGGASTRPSPDLSPYVSPRASRGEEPKRADEDAGQITSPKLSVGSAASSSSSGHGKEKEEKRKSLDKRPSTSMDSQRLYSMYGNYQGPMYNHAAYEPIGFGSSSVASFNQVSNHRPIGGSLKSHHSSTKTSQRSIGSGASYVSNAPPYPFSRDLRGRPSGGDHRSAPGSQRTSFALPSVRPSSNSSGSWMTLPQRFELNQAWKTTKALRHTEESGIRRLDRGSGSLDSLDDVMEDQSFSGFNFAELIMAAPTSLPAVAFDLAGMLLILYDFIVIPLWLLGMDDYAWVTVMSWAVRTYWTFAIPRRFCTGYVTRDGGVELRPKKVLRRYLFGWFVFDLIVVCSDWIEFMVIFGGTQNVIQKQRPTFMFLVRCLRLARLLKLPSLMEEFSGRFQSDRTLVVINTVNISFIVMGVGHLIACLWYYVGSDYFHQWTGIPADRTWIGHYGLTSESFGFRYTTAVHWAITQFIGSMEVQPQNIYERSVAVAVLIVSFILSAVFVAYITASITRLQMIAWSQESHFAQLRKFLRNRGVSKSLARRVLRSAQHAVQVQAVNITELDTPLLALISEPLRVDVHMEIYSPLMERHAFFHQFALSAPVAMQELCHSCVTVNRITPGDVLFHAHESPRHPRMYFMISGKVGYSSPFGQIGEENLTIGHWACEATLWTQWVHIGNAVALKESTILSLEVEAFQDVIPKAVSTFVSTYAKHFVEHLNEYGTVLTDLRDDYFDIEGTVQHAVGAAAEVSNAKVNSRRPVLMRWNSKELGNL
eukprot:TRINITY_DN58697_c0_g1_i1.p1 TRINITY_DN58697_c0_g1~~TRINITY_DN58697_c0_g1_i1.p1  ORF type:complete len:1205 (+),score=229.22 TRINITY_DN58697_c0_g1_i1:103-3717(+)